MSAIDAFSKVAKAPSYPRAMLLHSQDEGEDSATVIAMVSQRSLARRTKITSTVSVGLSGISKTSEGSLEVAWRAPSQGELADVALWSMAPSGTRTVIVRSVASPDDKAKSEQHFQLWQHGSLLCSQVLDKFHGKAYSPSDLFGGASWSSDETRFLYSARAKIKQGDFAFDEGKESKDKDKDKDSSEPSHEIKRERFEYTRSWGEGFSGCEQARLFVATFSDDQIDIARLEVPLSLWPGQAVFAPHGDNAIVFVAWPVEERDWSGLLGCTNRRAALYRMAIGVGGETAECAPERLTSETAFARSPRFSPDGTVLVWLETDLDTPHGSCSRLMAREWHSNSGSNGNRVVVAEVETPLMCEDTGEMGFPGLYASVLAPRCWLGDNRTMLVDSSWGSERALLQVNTKTGRVMRVHPDWPVGTYTLLDVLGDVFLVSYASPDTPPTLLASRPSTGEWTRVLGDDTTATLKRQAVAPVASYTIEQMSDDPTSAPWEIILLLPQPPQQQQSSSDEPTKDAQKPRLIVVPHGGPHTSYSPDYNVTLCSLCALGYAVLLVNYRGSLGYGQAGVRGLLGHIGDADVADVRTAVERVRDSGKVDPSKIAIFGGSHGGFIGALMTTKYPDLFSAAVLRNPVTNVAAMPFITDIPDWAFMETGMVFSGTNSKAVTSEEYTRMVNVSPLTHIASVVTPTLLLLGAKDQRVPMSQGLAWYHALVAKGVATRLYVYPNDGHPLSSVEAEADGFCRIAEWLAEHL